MKSLFRTLFSNLNRMKSYNDKRDFSKTKEPRDNGNLKGNEQPVFVIQKHDATTLHYDFRLEIGGTLKSWSVPKGPSTDPSVKRMAIPTEDHPLTYANFEGTIPEEEYGGGTVMVWDKGTIKSIKKDENNQSLSLEESFDKGSIEVYLEGQKLQGGYNLIEMKGGRMKGNWLLVKQDDKEADARRNPVSTQSKSVLTGRSLAEIARDEKENKNK